MTNPVEIAYQILVEVFQNEESTETDLSTAIEEAIGYLGEALDE